MATLDLNENTLLSSPQGEVPLTDSYSPLIGKYEEKTSIASDILGFAGATIGDFAASVWNSLPGTTEVDTADLLGRIDSNSLRMYEEHPDAVHAASFIGGIFAPAGLAMKGMKLARDGSKGVNWFSTAGKEFKMKEIAETISKSGVESELYKQKTRALWGSNLANVVVDNLAMEVAILGTMNAHPFMEDYVKNPVSSFATSMLLGTAIVAPISHIGLRGEVRKIAQGIYGKSAEETLRGKVNIDLTGDLSTQMSQHQSNIDNWSLRLEKSEELNLNGVTKELLTNFISRSKALQMDTFDAMASVEVRALDPGAKQALIQQMTSAPERFAGINSVGLATAKEEASIFKKTFGKLLPTTTKPGEDIPLTKLNAREEVVQQGMVFSPKFNAFFLAEDLKRFGTAADLAVEEKNLTKGMRNDWYYLPNYDADLEILSNTSSKMDLEYLRKLKAVDELSDKELANIKVSPHDLPTLNAVMARIEKIGLTDPALASSLRVSITKEQPNWNAVDTFMMQQIPVVKVNAGVDGVGVKASYLQDIRNTVEKSWGKFDLSNEFRDADISDLVHLWKGGKMNALRDAVDDAFRPSQFTSRGAPKENIAAVKRMYDSKRSTGLRDALMQHADSEGYAYLYRGLKGEGFGAASIESYTTNAAKAAEFGTPHLYRVKVSDILGGIRDMVGKAGYDQSTEILVMTHTRESLKDLPVLSRALALPNEYLSPSHFGIDVKGLKTLEKQNIKNLTVNLFEDFKATSPNGAVEDMEKFIKAGLENYVKEVQEFASVKKAGAKSVITEASYSDLQAALLQEQKSQVDSLLKLGSPAEEVSLRTGMPLSTIEGYMTGALKLDDPATMTRSYTQASEVGVHLNPANRGIQLGTTSAKIPVAQMRASNNSMMLDEMDAVIKDTFLSSSQSAIAQEIGVFLRDKNNSERLGMLKQGLAAINSSTLGSKFWQSTDFALRDMGPVGEIITAMGKDSQHLYTQFTNKLLTPISNTFSTIVKDAAAVIEFNTAREVNASIKGYREIRDGVFWKQNAEIPFKDVVDATGKVVGKERNMEEVMHKGASFKISTSSVLSSFKEIELAGRELYALNATYRKTLGLAPINDLGFWMPAVNPRDKYITYVIDKEMGTTRLLWGNTPAELKSAEDAFSATLTVTQRKYTDLVRKGEDQVMYNKLQGRHDPMFMEVADVSSFHSGASARAIVSTNTNAFSELANAYEHYLHRSVGNTLELHYSDVMQQLDSLSTSATIMTKGQPVGDIQKTLNLPTDAGMVVKNTILGKRDLKEYTGWGKMQEGVQTGVEMTLQTISKVMEPVLNPTKGLFGGGKSKTDKEWENLIVEMDARGIPNPFKDMDDALAKEVFHTDSITKAPNMTPRVVALSNNLAATMLLKVMELGQPLVNMLSLPVLTSAAVQRTFSPVYMGAKLKENFHLSTTKAMYDGARYLGHKDYQKYKRMGTDLGIMTPVVSEVTELLALTRGFDKSIMSTIEKGLESKTVELLSKPSEWSERAVRELSFATGVSLAKQAYPGLSDAGVMTFARNFVDTAVGNYTSVQRPVLFQGTLGIAMGLFQTYMTTIAQQIYRRFELRDYKSLSKMMLTQAGIFGMKGLPGFNMVSEQIGEHFSDQNIDLTTGTYRALGDTTADLVLYGLPSNLGPAVYTRGDIQPRVPNIAAGLQNIAAVNILKSGYDSAKIMGRAVTEIGDAGAAHAFAEALSVQSISRPVARISELFTGHAVTRSGNEVAGPDEIYSTQGIMARVFATRGLRESKAREARHLDTMYGSLDRTQRQEAVGVLSNHVRSGTLDSEILERVQEKYMRTGSPSGWRAAVNKVMIDTDAPGVSAVRNHLRPDSPSMLMIEDIE